MAEYEHAQAAVFRSARGLPNQSPDPRGARAQPSEHVSRRTPALRLQVLVEVLERDPDVDPQLAGQRPQNGGVVMGRTPVRTALARGARKSGPRTFVIDRMVGQTQEVMLHGRDPTDAFVRPGTSQNRLRQAGGIVGHVLRDGLAVVVRAGQAGDGVHIARLNPRTLVEDGHEHIIVPPGLEEEEEDEFGINKTAVGGEKWGYYIWRQEAEQKRASHEFCGSTSGEGVTLYAPHSLHTLWDKGSGDDMLLHRVVHTASQVVLSDYLKYERDAVPCWFDEALGHWFEYELLGLEQAVKGSDCIVLITDHPEFKNVDLKAIGRLMRNRIIVDGRRIIEPHQALKHGFRYYGIGYGKAYKL